MNLDDFGTARTPLNAVPVPTLESDPTPAEPSTEPPCPMQNDSLNQWAICGPNRFLGIGSTSKILDAGVYTSMIAHSGIVFEKLSVCVDEFIEFPESKAGLILSEIDSFWTKSKTFEDYGFLHRRGFLVYGPAGGGKTVLVQQVIDRVVKSGGIVFMCKNPSLLAKGLQVFRQVEPMRPVVCVYEDIDTLIERYGEADILSILDGEDQINKVLNLASTNYPEKLDKRIVGRPRRFDRVVKIEMPEDSVRRTYFKHKLKIADEELSEWVDLTKEFSFAAMAELVISVKCLGHSLTESASILRQLMTSKVSSKDFDNATIGFRV